MAEIQKFEEEHRKLKDRYMQLNVAQEMLTPQHLLPIYVVHGELDKVKNLLKEMKERGALNLDDFKPDLSVLAAEQGNIKLLELLKQFDISMPKRNTDALSAAIEYGHLDTAQFIFDWIAAGRNEFDVFKGGVVLTYLFECAAKSGMIEMMKLVVSQLGKTFVPGAQAALAIAKENKCHEVVAYLEQTFRLKEPISVCVSEDSE